MEYVIGGIPLKDDIEKFKNHKVHIVVGSPGRLSYLIQDKHIDISTVRLLILDEADKLMENSFKSDINYVFNILPQHKQVIMSSATYPETSKDIITKYMKNVQHVCPNNSNVLIGVEQKVAIVEYNCNIVNQTKIRYCELLNIFMKKQFKQCLVFCNYQIRVTELYKLLLKDNWPAEQLYGNQEQTKRLDAIKTLKEFKCRILIATDLAARGIDASNVDLVISFEPPYEWTTYLHRIGRAGRYGSYGEAITILAMGKEVRQFKKMISNVMSGTLNVKYLWSNKSLSLEDDQVISDSGHTDQIKSNDKVISECISSKVLDEMLSTSKNSCKIENFDDLVSSFENDVLENNSNVTCNKINLNGIDIDELLIKFENNNSKSEENINNKINGITKTFYKHNTDNTKPSEVDLNYNCNEISEPENKNSFCDGIKTKNLNININDDQIVCNNESMSKLGLPTSFKSKGSKNVNNKNLRKAKNKYDETKENKNNNSKVQPPCEIIKHNLKLEKNREFYSQTNIKSNLSEKNLQSKKLKYKNNSKFEKKHLDTTSECNSSDSSDEYSKKFRQNNIFNHKTSGNLINHQSNNNRKYQNESHSYLKWYNELKHITRQIEYMVYIKEMSK